MISEIVFATDAAGVADLPFVGDVVGNRRVVSRTVDRTWNGYIVRLMTDDQPTDDIVLPDDDLDAEELGDPDVDTDRVPDGD